MYRQLCRLVDFTLKQICYQNVTFFAPYMSIHYLSTKDQKVQTGNYVIHKQEDYQQMKALIYSLKHKHNTKVTKIYKKSCVNIFHNDILIQ